jgi:large subunit ribosomal protein L17
MRHGKKFNHLKRKKGHRTALLKSLAGALITHKRITTTLAKAKALRMYVEPLLTKSKTNTTHSRRVVFSNLMNKEVVKELFDVVAEKIADRPGGYVRIIKTGFRKSDSAEMAMIELVDFNTDYVSGVSAGTKSSRRRRGGKKKATDVVTPPVASNEEE